MEVGAGFQISANGTRVPYELGLGANIEAIFWEPEGKEIRILNTGETKKLFDLGAESVERYGYPYLMFHRAICKKCSPMQCAAKKIMTPFTSTAAVPVSIRTTAA